MRFAGILIASISSSCEWIGKPLAGRVTAYLMAVSRTVDTRSIGTVEHLNLGERLVNPDRYLRDVKERSLLGEYVTIVVMASLGANAFSQVFISGAASWMGFLLLLLFWLLLSAGCFQLYFVTKEIGEKAFKARNVLQYESSIREQFAGFRSRVARAIGFTLLAGLSIGVHAGWLYFSSYADSKKGNLDGGRQASRAGVEAREGSQRRLLEPSPAPVSKDPVNRALGERSDAAQNKEAPNGKDGQSKSQ